MVWTGDQHIQLPQTKQVCGGRAQQPGPCIWGEMDESENFIAPTILDYGTNWEKFVASVVMGDEVFGPLLPVSVV